MALQQYYRVAARLGDPDAQQELAFCLLNGKGCKKDKREAAQWYRAAVRRSLSTYGIATESSVVVGEARRERRRARLDLQGEVPIASAGCRRIQPSLFLARCAYTIFCLLDTLPCFWRHTGFD